MYILIKDNNLDNYNKAKELLELVGIEHTEKEGVHGSNTYKIVNQEQTKTLGFVFQPADGACPVCERKMVQVQMCPSCRLDGGS